jgi:transcriptional regulator with PAS, ATPase and Fis domain
MICLPKPGPTKTPGLSLDEMEKQAIIDALAKTGNNRQAAAKLLGIGERTLYRKIREYNL